MATVWRVVKLVDQRRLLRAFMAGGTRMATPGVRKAKSRSRTVGHPMAEAGGCSAGGSETGRCRELEPSPAGSSAHRR